MELPPGGLHRIAAPAQFEVRKATMDDLQLLVELFSDAGEMSRTSVGVERPLKDRRVWMALKEGVAVSAALTIAESAMLAWPESRQVSCNNPSTSGVV
jgi:hypothetical protein